MNWLRRLFRRYTKGFNVLVVERDEKGNDRYLPMVRLIQGDTLEIADAEGKVWFELILTKHDKCGSSASVIANTILEKE